jgi:ribosomal protein S18 acetylase RimI-like enzyme
MDIHTLKESNIADVTKVFNESFADYFIPFHLSETQLAEKYLSENVCTNYSVGAFENCQLVGFILHCFGIVDGKKLIFNAGTGVIPSARGNHLMEKMYHFILPKLKADGIELLQHEVMTINTQAIKSYLRTGFEVVRKLNCYKGKAVVTTQSMHHNIVHIDHYDWPKLWAFWDCEPTWQNSILVVENIKERLKSYSINDGKEILGYVVYNPASVRILQLAIDRNYRNMGLATQLIGHIAKNYGRELSILNIDDTSAGINAFVQKIGLSLYIEQYEMKMRLNQ